MTYLFWAGGVGRRRPKIFLKEFYMRPWSDRPSPPGGSDWLVLFFRVTGCSPQSVSRGNSPGILFPSSLDGGGFPFRTALTCIKATASYSFLKRLSSSHHTAHPFPRLALSHLNVLQPLCGLHQPCFPISLTMTSCTLQLCHKIKPL